MCLGCENTATAKKDLSEDTETSRTIIFDWVAYAWASIWGKIPNELWVAAEELEDFNNHIVGLIEVIGKYE